MCSMGEDDFGDEGGLHAMINDEQVNEFESCAKCGSKGILVKVKFRATECTDCFLTNTRHKFRAVLGSSKVLPKGAEVLLLFDGSAESIVLLDMLYYAQNQNTFKRLHVETKVLFIDENLIASTSASGAVNVHEVKAFLSKYNFPTFIVCIGKEDSLYGFDELDSYLDYCQGSNKFVESVRDIKTLTSRQDFIKRTKIRVIQNAADRLKCNFVFSPDISTTLATELLNCISLGRGSSAAQDISLLDDRLQNLKIVRPLRTLDAQEVKLYLQVNDLTPIKTRQYGELLGPNASIQNLTKQFIDDLQANFSSTVSTVFRTGDKMSHHSNNLCDKEKTLKCTFCKSHINNQATQTLQAKEFSRLVSTIGSRLENYTDLKLTSTNEENNSEMTQTVCHSCRNIQNDCVNKEFPK